MLNSNFTAFKVLKYLSFKCKKIIFLNLFFNLITSFAELLLVSSSLPFLAVLANDSSITKYPITIFLAKLIKSDQIQDLEIPIIIFFGISIFASTSLRLLNIWIINFTGKLISTEISVSVYSKIIYQPYKYFMNNNSSNVLAVLSKSVGDTSKLINNTLIQISNLILSTFLSLSIILINGKIAVYSLIFFSIIYLILGKNLKSKVSNNSKQIFLANRSLIKTSQETLGSIRNIILDANHKIFIKRFKYYSTLKNKLRFRNKFLGEFPKTLIEGLCLISIVIIVFFNINSNSDTILFVQLGAFIVGLQRLLPAIQKVYVTWISNRGLSADVNYTIKILQLKNKFQKRLNKSSLNFKRSIKFDSVSFSYANNRKSLISDFNLEIFKGERLGIIGKTGSGKSTITDLIMGLLKPSSGRILVDGNDINDTENPERIIDWRLLISHVPQSIFLIDNSISENIAFGIKKDLISMNGVIEAAKKSQINDFVESKSEKYNTMIGERGIKLSGGQQQRIGIARALYKKTEILILDEATSALDNETEIEFMNSLKTLNKDLTIIAIAHRKSTLKNFDRVIEISNGKIVADMNKEAFKDKYL